MQNGDFSKIRSQILFSNILLLSTIICVSKILRKIWYCWVHGMPRVCAETRNCLSSLRKTALRKVSQDVVLGMMGLVVYKSTLSWNVTWVLIQIETIFWGRVCQIIKGTFVVSLTYSHCKQPLYEYCVFYYILFGLSLSHWQAIFMYIKLKNHLSVYIPFEFTLLAH